MAKNDAIKFFDLLEKDASFSLQIAHARSEEEVIRMIHNHHLHFDAKECHSAFQERYSRPLKKDELHKMVAQGLIKPEVAARIPYSATQPHHGE